MDSFGARLANARKAKGYTQEQLAELLAVSRTSISRWESDKAMPDYGTIQQISRVLEYPFADQGLHLSLRPFPRRNLPCRRYLSFRRKLYPKPRLTVSL